MPLPGANTRPATPGFLTTTLRLCAGTQVMTEIYDSSPARAILRFILLALLCAIMAAFVGTSVQRGMFERAGRALDEEIGAFVFTPETVTLQKDPDTPRRFRLPYITLEYFPGDTFSRVDFNVDRTSDIGIIILPGGLASWSKVYWNGEDLFSAHVMTASELYAWLSPKQVKGHEVRPPIAPLFEMYSGPGLAEMLKEKIGSPQAAQSGEVAGSTDEGQKDPAISATGSLTASFALSMLSAIILLTTFGRNCLQIGLIVLLVSLVQYLRASTLPKGLVFKNVLTITVYSTFPAQIIATLIDAAGGGRFILFQILFVIIFFIYQIFAFRAVMNKICPQPERKDDDFDDPDF